MEQLDLNQVCVSFCLLSYARSDDGCQGGTRRKSPLRIRPLSVLAAGVGLATPPPSAPLPPPPGSPGVSYPSTAPHHIPSFMPVSGSPAESPPGSTACSGSIPSTPSFTGPSQPPSNYTQSQPLPQLPTSAHGLHTINEHNVSKDDLEVGLDVDRRVIKKEASRSPHRMPVGASDQGYEDDFATNRGRSFDYDNQSGLQHPSIFPVPNHSTAHQDPLSHSLGVPSSQSTGTLSPNGQAYGTITVSNSVASFPASNGAPVPPSVTTPLARDAPPGTHGSTASVPNGMVSAASMSEADSSKTPNVYINGLPPHFPEDQLYALAAPFGEVKSVRTFTRHVRDSESGYGFVL
jgi:RNA recognition motif. (a.k.a. RRM, RBD, or RNP domain)